MRRRDLFKTCTEMICLADAGPDIKLQEYTKMPLAEISAPGSAFSSIVPALQGADNAEINPGHAGKGNNRYI